jgi:hypothetical protein
MEKKPPVLVIKSNENHIHRQIERAISNGYVLQGNVVVVSGENHECHWVYFATMVLSHV